MEQKTVDVKDMSDIEIKAMISDERDKIDQCSVNIQILRAELARRIAMKAVT